MKVLKPISSLLFITLMAILIASLFGFNPLTTVAILIGLSAVLPSPKGVATMAVQKEIWEADIVGNLFKNNQFANRAFNADQYVLGGKVVHYATAGAPSAVTKNLTVFPATAVKRSDADNTYALDTYYSAPRHIERIEQYELAYDKRQSAVGEDQKGIIQAAMNGLLFRWAPGAANVQLTTGGAVSATISGGTGNRKAFSKANFAPIKVAWDRLDIPDENRVCLLTADHHQQLLDSFSDVERTNYNRVADITKGIVGEYLGITIMKRSTVLRYRSVGGILTPIDEQDPTYVAGTTDSAASLFWHDMSVERAVGTVQMFDGSNRPEYYGDIFSFLLRMGGKIRRAAGVYAVVEDQSA